MKRPHRVRYEMLLRVRDFGKSHPNLIPESSQSGQQAFAAVTRAIEQIETHETGRHIAANESRRDKHARRAVIVDRMKAIATTSKAVAVESGATLRLRMPKQVSDVAIAEAARRFLNLAEAHQDQFVNLGLPPTCLTSLRDALTAFEAALSDRRIGRAGVAAATAAIKAALTDGTRAARTLDTVVTNAAKGDPAVLAAWNRDRRVIAGIGKSEEHIGPQNAPAPASEAADTPAIAAEPPLKQAS